MRIVRDNDGGGNGFDKRFRDSLRNFEAPPAADIWDKIEYSLDADKAQRRHDHWYHALLLLLIPITALNVFVTYELGGLNGAAGLTDEAEASYSLLAFPGMRPAQLKCFSDILFNNDLTTLSVSSTEKNSFTGHSAKNYNDAAYAASSDASHINASEQFSAFAAENFVFHLPLKTGNLLSETSATPADISEMLNRKNTMLQRASLRGFHIGLEGGLNHSTIHFRQNTLSPFIGNTYNRQLRLSPYYGISVGYDFSERWGIEAEWLMRSWQGMNYSELRYGKFPIDGEINLEYMHLPVMAKYKFTRINERTNEPRVINLVMGLQYSRLLKAEVFMNDLHLQQAEKPFNRDEIGLLFGLEYDVYMNKNYFLTLGARASISSDATAFPFFRYDVSQTANILVGVNAAFHYMARKHVRR